MNILRPSLIEATIDLNHPNNCMARWVQTKTSASLVGGDLKPFATSSLVGPFQHALLFNLSLALTPPNLTGFVLCRIDSHKHVYFQVMRHLIDLVDVTCIKRIKIGCSSELSAWLLTCMDGRTAAGYSTAYSLGLDADEPPLSQSSIYRFKTGPALDWKVVMSSEAEAEGYNKTHLEDLIVSGYECRVSIFNNLGILSLCSTSARAVLKLPTILIYYNFGAFHLCVPSRAFSSANAPLFPINHIHQRLKQKRIQNFLSTASPFEFFEQALVALVVATRQPGIHQGFGEFFFLITLKKGKLGARHVHRKVSFSVVKFCFFLWLHWLISNCFSRSSSSRSKDLPVCGLVIEDVFILSEDVEEEIGDLLLKCFIINFSCKEKMFFPVFKYFLRRECFCEVLIWYETPNCQPT
ncbi:CMGC/SRPK protein kinase [Puccinia sorghi]|uniref:CMGC/SRPK protein kinase n=1 Tax=Puccinia sorghi TaxID=27349 RepID=A0A0L6VF48_9BASI|nr:CMGC/SRPK protein kinase [Puccinia sorghi]